MTVKTIEKKDIKDLLRQVSKKWSVWAPQRSIGGDVWMERLPKRAEQFKEALARIALGDEDILISPKELFFPQLEPLFEFKDGTIRETVESSAKFLLGVTSCDLQGMLFMDDFFKRNFQDAYYVNRIQRRFIVVVGCLTPPRPRACFCTSTHTGPFAERGYDLQLVDAGDVYFVESGSQQSKEFLTTFVDFFKDAPADVNNEMKLIKQKACKTIEPKVDFQKAIERMTQNDFVPKENYERIGERCIYCGACLYVCPTCTCFNVFDTMRDKEGFRYRNWDGCVFEGYTREASGHNPRKEKWLRTSRRYEHKLKYDYVTTGISGCVGCGRCLKSCPVGIGISKFIQEITEEKRIM